MGSCAPSLSVAGSGGRNRLVLSAHMFPRLGARRQMVAGGGSHQWGLLEASQGCAWRRVPLLAP